MGEVYEIIIIKINNFVIKVILKLIDSLNVFFFFKFWYIEVVKVVVELFYI